MRDVREAALQPPRSVHRGREEELQVQSSSSLQLRRTHQGADCPPAARGYHTEGFPHTVMEDPTRQQWMRPEGGTSHGHSHNSSPGQSCSPWGGALSGSGRLGEPLLVETCVGQYLKGRPCGTEPCGAVLGELKPAGSPCRVSSERLAL